METRLAGAKSVVHGWGLRRNFEKSRKMPMKLVAILLLLASTTVAAKTPWETYLDEPSGHNAARVEAITYSRLVEGGYDADDLDILRLQVLAADPAAFRLTYRLYRGSDGGLSEELAAILASSIRPHPEFFLAEVEALKRPCSEFDVDVPGPEYVDRPLARRYELRMRRAALESVASKALGPVRTECLARLAAAR
jgi:hypothetical protein